MKPSNGKNEAGGYWLEKNNSEYDQIHYYLKACIMDQGEVSKLEIWKIENLDLSFRYDRRTTNMLKLACWTNTSSLVIDNTVESVCNRGFSFNQTLNNGLEFSNGVIDFDHADESSISKEFTFIYSEIAVGRSFVYDSDLLKIRQPQPCVPVGYDSLYVPDKPLDRDNDGKFSLNEYQAAATFDNRDAKDYRHKYFIQDPLQVLPKYIVRFKLNTNQSSNTASGSAQNNGAAAANDIADDLNDYYYFDPSTYTPLTKQQKQSYNMSSTSGSGPLQVIEQTFNSTLESHFQSDPMVESKRLWLQKQLENCEEKVREVNLNYAEISEAIQEAANKATATLQTLTKQKLQTCLSIEIELRRQQEQLEWLDKSIGNQLNSTSKMTSSNNNMTFKNSNLNKKKLEFLKSYKYHSMFRNTLSRSKPNEILLLNTIHADIKINPDISIYLDPFYTGGMAEGKGNQGDKGNFSSDPLQKSNFVKYSREAAANGQYAVPGKPLYPAISNSIQNLINSEIETITAAIQEAMNAPGIPLPDSIIRPMITGERYEPPLHEILRGMEDDLLLHRDGRDHSNNAKNQNAKSIFEGAMKEKMGELPFNSAPHYHGNNNNNHVDEYRPPSPAGTTSGMSALDFTPSPKRGAPSEHSYAPSHHTQHTQHTQQSAHVTPAAPYYSGNGGTPGRKASVIMMPPTSRNATAGGTAAATSKQQQYPLPPDSPPTPQSMLSNTRGGTSPVPNDRLFQSSTYAGQAVKSISAVASSTAQHTQQSHYQQHNDTPSEIDLEHVHMSISQLLKVTATYPAYSMSELSARKKKQLQAKNNTSYEESIAALLSHSRIVNGERAVAEKVFFTLPFFATPPLVKLLYSTDLHNRSLRDVFQKTSNHRGPGFILIRSGDFVFGAYSSHPIAPTDAWSGSPACYLFSVTLDTKLPYHARAAQSAELSSVSDPLAFFIQEDSIFIGNGDLSIDEALRNGTSETENCFGIGLESKSNAAMCILAGSPLFNIDELEVWAVLN